MLRAAILIVFLLSVAPHGCSQSYNAIFNFGDSISDTGNLCTGSGGCPPGLAMGQPPYGSTHFGHPTGRCTDGRVVVDFLAERFGLPLLPPSRASGGDFKKGANMAIVGATAMDLEFFKSRGLGGSVWSDGSLGTQIQWFQQIIMPSICGSDCKSFFKNSLFIVGEFGGNDYNAALFTAGHGIADARSYVPQVVDRIASGVEALIGLGAADVVVPGVLPIGCFPVYLTLYPCSSKDGYDETGCLRSFNELSSYHNELLKQAVSRLRSSTPASGSCTPTSTRRSPTWSDHPMPMRAVVLIVFLLSVARHGCSRSYNAIYSFGDSISDTGNLCTGSGGCPSWITTGQPPYGNTHFGCPTGRCTDGRVVVDFLAEHLGLPMLPPSKASGGDFKKGANMAIIGATTMDFEFFKSHGLDNSIWNNGPLGTQIQWFQQLMPSICGTDCKSYLNNSLLVVGEFGGNDYNAPLFGGKAMAEVRTYVPQIIDKITSSLEALIGLGAVDVVVPGMLPIGCFPLYLTLYPSSSKDDYDEIGCFKSFNNLSSYHNDLLKQAVSRLQSKHAGVRLMYADFYAQVADMVRSPETFGLKYGLKVCCGAGGQGSYNYNNRARCGMAGVSACGDPEKHLVWDGIHLTDAAYRSVAGGWLNGTYCTPGILH